MCLCVTYIHLSIKHTCIHCTNRSILKIQNIFSSIRYRVVYNFGNSCTILIYFKSKTPIYDTSYYRAPTEDDFYQAVHAPDGTTYVVVESEDVPASNDKRALV